MAKLVHEWRTAGPNARELFGIGPQRDMEGAIYRFNVDVCLNLETHV